MASIEEIQAMIEAEVAGAVTSSVSDGQRRCPTANGGRVGRLRQEDTGRKLFESVLKAFLKEMSHR